MFKSTADNTQSRVRRAVTDNRANIHGIDGAVFDALQSDRDRALQELRAVEDKSSKLRGQIALARRRHQFNEKGQVSAGQVHAWEVEHEKLKQKITAIHKRLTELRYDKRQFSDEAHRRDNESFGKVFQAMAKEMLAGPIYERILVATIHRHEDMRDETA